LNLFGGGNILRATDNQSYGFGQPLRLLNPQFGKIINGNQIDQAACTTVDRHSAS